MQSRRDQCAITKQDCDKNKVADQGMARTSLMRGVSSSTVLRRKLAPGSQNSSCLRAKVREELS